MRLWSLHPSMLDGVGLVALWREGLLAQKVLQGQTKGYRFHPQLTRFRESEDPVAAIGAYLWFVADEAEARGYRFDASKIVLKRIAANGRAITIPVTQGQLEYEFQHLKGKLRVRDQARLRAMKGAGPLPHPMLRAEPGDVEEWEVV